MDTSGLDSLREKLETSLDEFLSIRSSTESKSNALESLERLMAMSLRKERNADMDYFFALQYTFECNIASRLLPWFSNITARLETIAGDVPLQRNAQTEMTTLSGLISRVLFLFQGLSLQHPATKAFLGRRYSLEVVIELLLCSRHVPSGTDTSRSLSKTPNTQPHLSSVILDTLLCILVDSTPALRAFEDCGGLQAVVKLLKRAGTPREVRMKCLEFLYFYLLDENSSAPLVRQPTETIAEVPPTPLSTAPSTPSQDPNIPKKPFISAEPRRPTSRYGSSTYAFTSTSASPASETTSSSTDSSPSSRSTSLSSTTSWHSTSSNASSSTAPSTTHSVPPSPTKRNIPFPNINTPKQVSSNSRIFTPKVSTRTPQQKALLMLKKEVDFVPISPQKVPGGGGPVRNQTPVGTPLRLPQKTRSEPVIGIGLGTPSGVARNRVPPNIDMPRLEQPRVTSDVDAKRVPSVTKTKSMEEKKELLGTMLGNVDALVEGVRKAGIWGLG